MHQHARPPSFKIYNFRRGIDLVDSVDLDEAAPEVVVVLERLCCADQILIHTNCMIDRDLPAVTTVQRQTYVDTVFGCAIIYASIFL